MKIYKRIQILSLINKILKFFITRLRRIWQRDTNKRTRVIIATLGILALGVYVFAIRAPSAFPSNVLVTVKKDAPVYEIFSDLESQHVIRNKKFMILFAKLYGADKKILSGDYIFKAPANAFTVLQRLSTGAFGLTSLKVKIEEGTTVKKIAEKLKTKILRFNKDKFIEIASKHEGYLYPDTYYFLPNAPEEKIVSTMTDNFHRHFDEIKRDAEKSKYSLHELVTLASIVELEAYKYQDRRKIAGVLYNRLARNMPLQVDVSFVYLFNKGSFQVTKKELRDKSPYNTYVHKGLPPGPICSPSMESLKATVYPVNSKWLFYLADKYGVTHFSSTYNQHLVKKVRYIDNR